MIAKQIRRYQQELDDAKAEYAELQNARLNEAAEIRKLLLTTTISEVGQKNLIPPRWK